MQEKFVNAIKTQVATKVSTKTKVLLGLMMMACLGGMFAIINTLNFKTLKQTRKVTTTHSNDYINLKRILNDFKNQNKNNKPELIEHILLLENFINNTEKNTPTNHDKQILQSCIKTDTAKTITDNLEYLECLENNNFPLKKISGYSTNELVETINTANSIEETYGTDPGPDHPCCERFCNYYCLKPCGEDTCCACNFTGLLNAIIGWLLGL
ncbi:MAG TPA: hypothetical protein PKL13_00675 [bacterium]|nr:hypothetical protein [bacterium]